VDDLIQIREKVTELLAQKQSLLLAIGGYGGSGKSTLANEIQREFPGSSIITLGRSD
jgi:uridine kinase